MTMKRRNLPLLGDKKAKKILKQLCQEHGVAVSLIEQLIDIQRDNLGRGRQLGITQEFSAAISEFLEERKETADASG